MSECKCDFRTKMVGDGCEVCNPAKALQYAKENIVELEQQRDKLLAALKSILLADYAEDIDRIATAAIAEVEEWK